MRDNMTRREFTAALILAPMGPAILRSQQIVSGTNLGMKLVKLAVPEFRPTKPEPKINHLADVFNETLWNDLDFSGTVSLVSRSFYPLGNFSVPSDIHPDDWVKSGLEAQYITFGSTEIGTEGKFRGQFTVDLHFNDLKLNQSVFNAARWGGGFDNDEAARFLAHNWANTLLETLGLGKGVTLTKIAYVADRGGDKEIYEMDYDGYGARPLTALGSLALTPAWSPDGSRIAFNGYRNDVSNIEVISRSDGKSVPFPSPGGTINTTPAWSPDGSKIAFASSRDKHGANDGTEIYIADSSGRNITRPMPRPAGSSGIDIAPVWNPKTGREIAFVSNRNGPQQIYRVNDDGTNVRRLVDEGGEAANPSWSPEGTFLAFAWRKAGSSRFEIFIHDLATGKESQLTQNSGDSEKPSWSPDGRHLVFESNRSGTLQIYSMLADGTKVRQLTRNGINKAPAWSGYITIK
jgi:TolB protein